MRPADVAGSSRAQASAGGSKLGPSAPTVHSQEPAIPPSPAGSVASGVGPATSVNLPRSVPGQSGPPSESSAGPSAGPRHPQFVGVGDDDGNEAWPDSDPESSRGDSYRQNLQEVSAFLDQKELEMNMIFAKMRAQLLHAIPASSSGHTSSKEVVSKRSDEVTAHWRDLGGPLSRALAMQRKHEKENQRLNESVARKRTELNQLHETLDQLGIFRAGTQPAASSSAAPSTEVHGLLQVEPRVGPQLPLPNTPHFPAASPRTAPPSPFELESEGVGSAGGGAFGSPLDNALKQNVSSFANKVDVPAAPPGGGAKPSMQRSDSVASSVSLQQMYKNSDGQGNTQNQKR